MIKEKKTYCLVWYKIMTARLLRCLGSHNLTSGPAGLDISVQQKITRCAVVGAFSNCRSHALNLAQFVFLAMVGRLGARARLDIDGHDSVTVIRPDPEPLPLLPGSAKSDKKASSSDVRTCGVCVTKTRQVVVAITRPPTRAKSISNSQRTNESDHIVPRRKHQVSSFSVFLLAEPCSWAD
jgi:hypothetical protein